MGWIPKAFGSTTKGDVLVHDGTELVRLAVGSDDQVLTADSAASVGVKWGAASGGGGSGPSSGGTYASRVAQLGPIAHWKLDETSGTTAIDDRGGSVGGGADGTYVGTPSLNQTGIDPEGTGCPDFDGTDDGITLSVTGHYVPAITFALWIEPDDVSSKQTIFELGGTGQGVGLHLRNSEIHALIWNGSGTIQATASSSVTADTVYHITAVYYPEGMGVALFVDGTLVDSDAAVNLWATTAVNGSEAGGIGATNNNTRYDDDTTGATFYDGKLSQAALWQRPLADWEADYLHAG